MCECETIFQISWTKTNICEIKIQSIQSSTSTSKNDINSSKNDINGKKYEAE